MVPAFLLTGFLGSGKTTLLNCLLAARPAGQGRMAVIVNELGAVGIDGSLLPASMTRQVELANGCICCILNEDLDTTILEILAGEPALEALLIETTGIAEPAPISWALAGERLRDRVRMAAVITVVDAIGLPAMREASPTTVEMQIEYADVVVLSKLDLVPPPERGALRLAVEGAVRALNPNAPILDGPAAEVTADLWRMLGDPSLVSAAAVGPGELVPAAPGGGIEMGGGRRTAAAAGSAHGIDSVWLPIEETLDLEVLEELMAELPREFIRVKGIARVVDGSTGSRDPHYAAFHRVGARFSSERLNGDPGRGTTPPTRVVGIGHGVQPAPLAACIAAAVLSSDG
jgi:G3E family GTPase